MRRLLLMVAALCGAAWCAAPAHAGGGPSNVLVLVNENSPASLEIANYYRVKRQVPAGNFWRCRVPVQHEMTAEEFNTSIATPLKAWLQTAPCGPRIRFIVATEGFPYRIKAFPAQRAWTGDHYVGISAALATLDGRAESILHNPLAGGHTDWYRSERAFTGTQQLPYLGFALMGDRVDDVLRAIDNGAASDGTRPKGTIYLFKGVGPRQRLLTSTGEGGRPRDQQQPVIDALAKKGITAVKHAHDHSLSNEQDVMGYYTGFTRVKTDGFRALPGALGDHLTSFGGIIKGKNGQMPCTRFLAGGLTASYGTVTEPLNVYLRFPEAWLFDRYTDGFSAIESYWMATGEPRIGIFVGEPLASPYAVRPAIAVEGVGTTPLTGVTTLTVHVTSAGQRPVRDFEVWLDGVPLAGAPRIAARGHTLVEMKIGEAGASFRTADGWSVGQLVDALAKAFPASAPVTFEARGTQLLLRAKKPGPAGNDLQWDLKLTLPGPAAPGTNPLAVPVTVDLPTGTLSGGKPPETRRAAVRLRVNGAAAVGGELLTIRKGKEAVRLEAAKGETLIDFAQRLLGELNKTSIAYKRTPAEIGPRGGNPIPARLMGKTRLEIVLGASQDAEAGNGEELVIAYTKPKDSKFNVSPLGTRATEGGRTVETHASAVLNFDAEAPAVRGIPLHLDCTTLATGPHRLRVMVEEALPLAVRGWRIIDFEVQNEKGQLKLDGLKDGASVVKPFKLTPKLFRAARGARAEIRVLVDGRVIEGTTKNKRAITIDPAALTLGRGVHEVQAEILDDATGAPFLRSRVIRFNYAVARPAPPAPPKTGKDTGRGKKKKK